MKGSNFKNIVILIVGILFLTFVYIRDVQKPLGPISQQQVFNEYDVRCIDGDTFEMNVQGQRQKIRLLAIDSPEDTKVKEEYGDVASAFTCQFLMNASEIVLEADKGNEMDKYQRNLYWVFADGEFLQEALVQEGLAEIKYVHKKTVHPLYLKRLELAQKKAQVQRLNIWSK